MTDQQKSSLQALSQDLYRVAIGRYRGQTDMAIRFTKEAQARLAELSSFDLTDKISQSLNSKSERSAEDLLMYSTLIKNITLSR